MQTKKTKEPTEPSKSNFIFFKDDGWHSSASPQRNSEPLAAVVIMSQALGWGGSKVLVKRRESAKQVIKTTGG